MKRRLRSPCFDLDEKECLESETCEWMNNRCQFKRRERSPGFISTRGLMSKKIHPDFVGEPGIVAMISQYLPEELSVLYEYDPERLMSILQNKEYTEEQLSELLLFVDVEEAAYLNNLFRFNMNKILYWAAEHGNQPVVNRAIQLGANDYRKAMEIAAKNGQKDTLQLLLNISGTNRTLHSKFKNRGKKYHKISNVHRLFNLNQIMMSAAEAGQFDIVKLMLKLGANNYDEAMVKAGENGHFNIVQKMIQKGGKAYDRVMKRAAVNGHEGIVKWMLKKGATSYNDTFYNAAGSGHEKIMKMMLSRGVDEFEYIPAMTVALANDHEDIANFLLKLAEDKGIVPNISDYNTVMMFATIDGHPHIVEMMLALGANNYNEALRYAAKYGHKDIVKMMLESGATNYNEALRYAAKYGHKDIIQIMINEMLINQQEINLDIIAAAAAGGHSDIVEMILELGATDYNLAMRSAALGGQEHIVQMMIDLGANDYQGAMLHAAKGGNSHIIQWMMDLGANNYNHAMIAAGRGGHEHIVKWMLEKGADQWLSTRFDAIDAGHEHIPVLLDSWYDRFRRI